MAAVARAGPDAEWALSLLYDRYRGAVYGLALRVTGSVPDAEEVLQDTFWNLWRHAGGYEPGRVRFATWLLRIAHNRAISELRRRGTRPPADRIGSGGSGGSGSEDVPAVEEADTAPSAFEQTWQAHLRQVLRQALLTLPPEQAHALELAYFGGLSHTQIAAAQGAPPSTVKTRLAMALKKLAVHLERSGLGAATPATAATAATRPHGQLAS